MAETRIKLQKAISDLATIREGAAAGATAVQSVNGVAPTAGAVTITGTDVLVPAMGDISVSDALVAMSNEIDLKANAADLRYALDAAPREPNASGIVTLDDRTVNRVVHSESVAILVLGFPPQITGRARDFIVRLELAANVDAPPMAIPANVAIENADGNLPTIATTTTAGETAVTLLYFSETTAGHFLLKGESVTEVA